MIKVGLVSLGCPKNLVDSEVMLGTLQGGGYAITPEPAEADIIVVNTCTFIGPARQESVETILEMAEFKRTGRCRRLVVAGCMVQQNHDELRQAIPEIDALVGLNDIERIAEACSLEAGARFEASRSAARYLYSHDSKRTLATPGHTAYLKISEGCDHTCAFCAIPSFRGTQRSRPIPSIVEEASRLARAGVVEICLIAQDTTDYGSDLGDGTSAAGLLRALDGVEEAVATGTTAAAPSGGWLHATLTGVDIANPQATLKIVYKIACEIKNNGNTGWRAENEQDQKR